MLSRLTPPWTDPVADVAARNGAAIGQPFGSLLGLAAQPATAGMPGARARFARDLSRLPAGPDPTTNHTDYLLRAMQRDAAQAAYDRATATRARMRTP